MLFSCAAVAACGGGGSGAPAASGALEPVPPPAAAPAPAPGPAASEGSVAAAFVPGANPKYALFSVGSQSTGVLQTHVQQADGAVTTLNDDLLSGTPIVLDKAGDASFAMGRWAGGTANTRAGAQDITAQSGRAWHYLLSNYPAAFPESKSLTCDAGKFTSPTYVGGASGIFSGQASGSATLNFSAGKANAGITLNVAAGSSGSKTGTANALAPGVTSVVGGSIGTNADAIYLNIGEADAGTFTVQGGYLIKVASGARYMGVYRFRCQ